MKIVTVAAAAAAAAEAVPVVVATYRVNLQHSKPPKPVFGSTVLGSLGAET